MKNNTTWFWAVAVFSIVTPNRNYVLGFEPVGAADEYDRALNTMLERTEDRFSLYFSITLILEAEFFLNRRPGEPRPDHCWVEPLVLR